MRTRWFIAAAVALLVSGVMSTAGAAASASQVTSAAKGPCGRVASAPRYKHVIWIWMENHSYSTIIGSSQARFINKMATECGLATNYHNISHPSLPNYVAATSGLGYSALQKFTPDCNPVPKCSTSARSIFAQGESWRAYEESMPSNCYQKNSGNYAVRHDPPPYYTKLSGCAKNDVPYPRLATDLAQNRLPAFSFITPNLIDDMHNGTIADGNRWLAANLPPILSSTEYQSGSTVVMITWDEGEGGSSDRCATNTTDVGCHVAAIVISPSTRAGTRSAKLFNHYSLLGTAEQLLHLPKLGRAAKFPTMTSAFNL
jgi:phosphatidylinositol-3-phosphatase